MKTRIIWALPDGMWDELLAKAAERRANGLTDLKEQNRLWYLDVDKAKKDYGFPHPLFNPQLQGELF